LVYVADLLVVMTDWLKIVRVHARNVPRVHGHKRLDDNASLTSLTGVWTRKMTVRVLDAPGHNPAETQTRT